MNNYSIGDVTKFVEDNDIKFVKLAFCDIFGNLKNISIMTTELERAFEIGIPFDASAIKGFMNIEESDLFLVPDPCTMSILPWRPSQGRVIRMFCDIKYPNGEPFEGNGRYILKRAIKEQEQKGYTIKIGSECEFYLFELDEKGNPTYIPHDETGYCDISPLDKGENVRREICLTLEEMGIKPEMSHHEQGRGQHEIDFRYSEAFNAADNLITFKSVVKNIAYRNGLYASFLPKPIKNSSGSGLHINISVEKDRRNIFDNDTLEGEAENFVAGVMNRIKEISVFTNSVTNSYSRLGEMSAPKFITWSKGNRSQLVRIPASFGEYKRMELRNPDPACSPYFAFALIIYAGFEGIEKGMKLPPSNNLNLFNANEKELEKLDKMPDNLSEAIKLAKNSDFVKNYLPKDTINKFLVEKENEWELFDQAENKEEFEMMYYFKTI